MQDTQSILQTHGLSIGYRQKGISKPLTEKLDLAIYPGELICLLGPNGSGKSTLIRTLAGLQPMLEGSVEIQNQLIHELKTVELAQKLSLVLTERVQTGNLNVYSLIALGRYPYSNWLGNLSKEDKKMIRWAMEATQTEAFADKKVNQLSDGQCQKVMLARALAQDTPLIILDEPTAHLDLPNRISMMRLLHQLARQTNKSILLSTHELDLALQTAHQVWLLLPEGQLKTGVPEDLVLKGTFEAAFNTEGFQFDKATGTFTIHTGEGTNINLVGEDVPAFWTRRALLREGFQVGRNLQDAFTIELSEAKGNWIWRIKLKGIEEEHQSIQNLLQSLKKHRLLLETEKKKAIYKL